MVEYEFGVLLTPNPFYLDVLRLNSGKKLFKKLLTFSKNVV